MQNRALPRHDHVRGDVMSMDDEQRSRALIQEMEGYGCRYSDRDSFAEAQLADQGLILGAFQQVRADERRKLIKMMARNTGPMLPRTAEGAAQIREQSDSEKE